MSAPVRPRSTVRAAGERYWASGRPTNLVEQVALAYQPYQMAAPFLRVLPLALDASALLNVVAYVARRGRSGLLDVTDLGLIRLYVGESVPVEVERNLSKRAISMRRPADELVAAWEEQVRPRLRVVDTHDIDSDELALIVERHEVDRPTATLSLVLGARLTWAEDPDLVELGYAENLRVDVLLTGASAAGSFDLTAHLALSLSPEAIAAAARGLREAVASPGLGRNLILAIVVISMGVLTIALIKDPRRVRDTAAKIAAQGVDAMRRLYEFRLEAARSLPSVARGDAHAEAWRRVARCLAVAPAPLSPEEIAAATVIGQATLSVQEVTGALEAHPAFVRGPSGWQLGTW